MPNKRWHLSAVNDLDCVIIIGIAAVATFGRGGNKGISFSTEMAKLVSDQLSRFVTFNPHQLAGQVGNLDFWLAEVRHALAVIDGYGVRFVRLDAAQEQYVARHNVTVSEVGPGGVSDRAPPVVRRVPDRALQQSRRVLVEAATKFLERCRAEGLVSDAVVSAAHAQFGE